MTSRTGRWRGVSPVASAGPSGISRTRPASGPVGSAAPPAGPALAGSRVCLATRGSFHVVALDRSGCDRPVQTSVRTWRVFVRAAWYNSYRRSIEYTFEEEVATVTTAAVNPARRQPVRLPRRGRVLVVLGLLVALVVGFSTGHFSS